MNKQRPLQEARASGSAPLPIPSVHNEVDFLHQAIEEAIDHLPAQGPITVFIHHNTLHAFEQLPFDQALQCSKEIFGCQTYLSEKDFHHELIRGRLHFSHLRAVLNEDLGAAAAQLILPRTTRLELRLAMLQHLSHKAPAAELRWFVAQTDALTHFRPEAPMLTRAHLIAETRRWVMRDLRSRRRQSSRLAWLDELFERFSERDIETWDETTWEGFTLQALWRTCCAGARAADASHPTASTKQPSMVRHRDLLWAATGMDSDEPVAEVLVRFCAAFLDQGLGPWPLPGRDEGFLRAFVGLFRQPGLCPRWLTGLSEELTRLQQRPVLHGIHESLVLLGVPVTQWPGFLTATLLALRGWGGMIRQLEQRGDRVARPIPPNSLVEFLAVRLLLDRLALTYLARTALGYTGPLAQLHATLAANIPRSAPAIEPRALAVFELAQLLGWSPEELHNLGAAGWTSLLAEIEAFDTPRRQRVFQIAYERTFRQRALDALLSHQSVRQRCPDNDTPRPRWQAIFCIDEREESYRRHLEELAPEMETFGAAGFFSVPMYYRGQSDAYFVPLCPVAIQPSHWISEQPLSRDAATLERHQKRKQLVGVATHGLYLGSRFFAIGTLLSAGFGVLASIPLVLRTLFPRLFGQLWSLVRGLVHPPTATQLLLHRDPEKPPGPEEDRQGFTLAERVAMARRLLTDIGLTRRLARVVLVVGHGSSSQNNPHRSAYDCGACGGSAGGPNARALAQILNDPEVREQLAHQGLILPRDTVFVAALHNTCDDSVNYFDETHIPASHQQEFASLKDRIEQASNRNAHERCRRFQSAPLTLSFEAARQHVEARSQDLAQTRPELGHATNALCLVARRCRSRGLFLDRRAFLVSYDPTQEDEQGSILARLLAAVVPVCAGINLEYYFSRVDSQGWGCGSKLPHNITALLGVMDGAASDLRTGLPWQMVELHKPIRLLIVVESRPEVVRPLLQNNASIGRLVHNGWVQLALLDPDSASLWHFQHGEFVSYTATTSTLPQVPSSTDWYRGWREHLDFASIVPEEGSSDGR